MDIGLIRWEIEQKEKEFNKFVEEKVSEIWSNIAPRIRKNIVPQSSPYYENGKILVNYIEVYPYGRVISYEPMEIREFIAAYCK